MKNLKRICITLLSASLLFAGRLTLHAQSPQQSDDPAKPESSPAKQPEKKNTDGTPTPTKSSQNNSSAPNTPASASSSTTAVAHKNSPGRNAGTVWVNTQSGVYHKPGTRWYGKTKQGKYMTEADAIKAGYKAAAKN
jgi:hypothetical protein